MAKRKKRKVGPSTVPSEPQETCSKESGSPRTKRWFADHKKEWIAGTIAVIVSIITLSGTVFSSCRSTNQTRNSGPAYNIQSVAGGNNQFGSGNTQIVTVDASNVSLLQTQLLAQETTIRSLSVLVKQTFSTEWTGKPQLIQLPFPQAFASYFVSINCSGTNGRPEIRLNPKALTLSGADGEFVLEYEAEVQAGSFPLGKSILEIEGHDTFAYLLAVPYDNWAKDHRAVLQNVEALFVVNGAKTFRQSTSASFPVDLSLLPIKHMAFTPKPAKLFTEVPR